MFTLATLSQVNIHMRWVGVGVCPEQNLGFFPSLGWETLFSPSLEMGNIYDVRAKGQQTQSWQTLSSKSFGYSPAFMHHIFV